MYSIKLVHGQGMTFDAGNCEIVKTVYAQLIWEGDDGITDNAAQTHSCIWTPKTAKRADDWARRKGLDLKADYGAYLRKHGERKEVALANKARAEKAEKDRVYAIRRRCAESWEGIVRKLKLVEPGLAHHLETGESWTPLVNQQ